MALNLYKKLIDDLVEVQQQGDVTAARVRKKQLWPTSAASDLVKQNRIIKSLNDEDRETVAEMLQSARDDGIHDVLVYLQEEMDLNDLRITINGTELPVNPFWDLFHDWQYRCSGESWPDEKS